MRVKDKFGMIHNFPDEANPEDIISMVNEHEASETKNRMNKFKFSTGAERTPFDTVRDAIAGLVKGAGKGGETIAELATGGYSPKGVDFAVNKLEAPTKSAGGELTKGIASYLPYGVAGGESLLGQVAAGAAHGGATAEPGQENLFGYLPEGRGGAALEGAILNALPGIPRGIQRGYESLRPSNILRGNLSPEELERNLRITEGTETGLGDVIGSPYLKRQLENTLTNVPFSGANESLQRTGSQVVQKGEKVLEKLLGKNNPENIPSQLSDELINQYEKHQTTKGELYKEADKIADDVKLKLELPNFSKRAKEVSDAIESTNLLKTEPDVAKIFNKMKNYKNPVQEEEVTGKILDTSGKPIINEKTIKYPSLKEANILKGKLNQYAKIAGKSPNISDRNLASVFGQLASSLKKDINETISQSGSKELKNAYLKAEENYKKNFSPFLDKEIYKYISGNKDPETIVQNFIRTSPGADLASHLGKLARKMPPQSRDLLAYSYLSRAVDNEGNLNPAKMSTAIKKLGPNQLKELVPNKSMRDQLLDYIKFENMNKEAQNLMFNPKTGQRNQDILMTGLLGALGHVGSGNIAALGAPAAAIVGGRMATKALTNPALREKLVRKMIENKPKFDTIPKRRGANSLMQGIAAALNRNQE